MWPLPKRQYEHVCLAVNSSKAAFGWITQSPKNESFLKAYKIVAWGKSNLILSSQLNTFVKEHKLQNSFITIALSNPLIHEQLVRLSTASPLACELASGNLKKLLWDYRYLHTLDDGQSLFYICGIERSALFSYQLIAQQTTLHLMSITSGYMALINAYANVFGTAFRRSQLAVDLLAHDYHLERSISIDSITRLLSIDPVLNLDILEEKVSLLTMIGLYNTGRS